MRILIRDNKSRLIINQLNKRLKSTQKEHHYKRLPIPIPARVRMHPTKDLAIEPPTKGSQFERQSLKPILAHQEEIRIINNVAEFREWRRLVHAQKCRLAFVPTMGALHVGHLSLIEEAAKLHEQICVSIYVNPTQFGVSEDLDSYPQTWFKDLGLIKTLNKKLAADGRGQVTCVFSPSSKEMYPGLPPSSEIDADGSFVTITPLGKILEGASRPVFFRGVATVVMKLLNIVQPDTVIFGQKDIQQVVLINRMIKDFHIDTQINLVFTKRLPSKLAFSSRNVYLGRRREAVGTVLYQSLQAAANILSNEKVISRSEVLDAALAKAAAFQDVQRNLAPSERARFEVEYFSLADPVNMEELQSVDPERGAILSGAVKMLPLEEIQDGEDPVDGARTVRLIDNLLLHRNATLKTMGISAGKGFIIPEYGQRT